MIGVGGGHWTSSILRPFSAGGGVPAFAPTDIASLFAWWEPITGNMAVNSDGSGGDPADLGTIGYVADQSGNGYTATQATVAARPGYEDFPGAKHAMRTTISDGTHMDVGGSMSLSGDFTFIMAVSAENASDRHYAFTSGVNGSGTLFIIALSNDQRSMGFFDGAWKEFEAGQSPSGSYVLTWKFDATNNLAYGYRDGVLLGSVAFTPVTISGDIQLFARDGGQQNFVDASFANMMIFDEALSDTDREAVEAYAGLGLLNDVRYGADDEFTISSGTQIGTDVLASQGVMSDFTNYWWTTADPDNLTIYTHAYDAGGFGAQLFSRDASADATATIDQVNGMHLDGSKLYVSANNHPNLPHTGYILEYDVEANGSLTYVTEYSVGAHTSEGLVKVGDEFFVVYHNIHAIARYNSGFVLQELHNLSSPDLSDLGDDYYQDIDVITIGGTQYFIVNVHGLNEFSPLMAFYTFDGSDFTYAGAATPPTNCMQGFVVEDDSTIVFARRPISNANPPNHVVRATISAA